MLNNIVLKNNKSLPCPTFFMISNLGGGGSDKYRESVYQNIYGDVPTLYNYYYLVNKKFAAQELSELENFDNFHNFINFVQTSFLNKKFFYNTYAKKSQSGQILLLDSGASNIINDLISGGKEDMDLVSWKEILWEQAVLYYEFADRYKFDMVIGFDIGGKYTFKGIERKSSSHISINKFISANAHEINHFLASKTMEYLKERTDFYPSLYITVHGTTPEEFTRELEEIKEMESQNNFNFFGVAIGGVASSKGVHSDWFKNMSGPPGEKNTYLVTKVTTKISEMFKDRPIHILGGGGIKNIIPAYLAGASSFDTQTPGRRAYDGSGKVANEVFDDKSKGTFGKYMPAILDSKGNYLNRESSYDYVKINSAMIETLELCDCPACSLINDTQTLKEMYSKKAVFPEATYFAKQLMNIHAIYQHIYLCNYIRNNRTLLKCDKVLSNGLQDIIVSSKRILNEVNYI